MHARMSALAASLFPPAPPQIEENMRALEVLPKLTPEVG